MAEYLANLADNLDEATTTHLWQDFRAGLLPERDLCFWLPNRLHYLTKRSVSVGVISTMLLDSWSNNLSLSVAKTCTYWGHSHSKGL